MIAANYHKFSMHHIRGSNEENQIATKAYRQLLIVFQEANGNNSIIVATDETIDMGNPLACSF